MKFGRPLIWAISAFGFPATAIGGLAGRVRILDCDPTGMLDLDELAALSPSEWDGLLVTNIFGLAADFSGYSQICHDQSKPMVIDAALSFPGPRQHALGANEVISFHHTKPWGFGEGGCAIVPTEDASTVHAFLNFGVGCDRRFGAYATNGKMSDLAAAAVAQRLELIESWAPLYNIERKRLTSLVAHSDLRLLRELPAGALAGHLPVLAPLPFDLPAFISSAFDVRRYYRPLAVGFPCADSLYDRIVNVPCHPGMRSVLDDEIVGVLKAVRCAG
jgi:dTDP-4-amino-4,6-dideoxygalactose transaminase